MRSLLLSADGLLRGPRWATSTKPVSLQTLLTLIVACGAFYGAVMGSFGGMVGERAWQVLYSATKVPLLLLATFAIGLPSFFVLNTLWGLRADFHQVVRALLATQAGLTVILASLAPYTAFCYASVADYKTAVFFNGVMFASASLLAQVILFRLYEPLVQRNAKHRFLMRLWVVLYSFVGIQMAWVLRPFIGDPKSSVQFFRPDVLDNAYVIVFQLVWDVLAK